MLKPFVILFVVCNFPQNSRTSIFFHKLNDSLFGMICRHLTVERTQKRVQRRIEISISQICVGTIVLEI